MTATQVTVSGHVLDDEGLPATGKALFFPPGSSGLTDPLTTTITAGAFSIALSATDDPGDLTPAQPWLALITFDGIDGHQEVVGSIWPSRSNTTVDILDIVRHPDIWFVRRVVRVGSTGPAGLRKATVQLISTPLLGGYLAECVLDPNGSNECHGVNVWKFPAGHTFKLHVTAPIFTAGTLALSYAELDITDLAGTNSIGVGNDGTVSMTSAESLNPLALSDNGEQAHVGTDLVHNGTNTVTTTAGGVFAVHFFAQFQVSTDFA